MGAQEEAVDIDNWTTQLRKGLLELCIVNLLAQGELYGYDLVKQLAEVRGLVVTEGTIYPLLSRLRKLGLVTTRLVESSSGPARRYYALTPAGLRLRATMNAYWKELMRGIEHLQGESEADHG
ncbi:MAG: PadR family transcriptional regulator [Candidatus Hydrogenedentes bacterium]|nr:PadR family transcriptional regulator [Candidatus Hydrogenedentota bacterium]